MMEIFFKILRNSNLAALEAAILQKQFEINMKDEQGDTPLLKIVCDFSLPSLPENYLELCKLLIKHGADINAKNNKGTGVLHYLVRSRENFSDIHFFLQHGADINIQNHEGNTLLHLACKYSNIKLALFLLQANANVTIVNSENKTALECFLYLYNLPEPDAATELIDKLLSLYPHSALPQNSTDLLNFAVRQNKFAYIEALLQRGQNLDVYDQYKTTPLSLAVYNNLEMVKFLVEKGASLNYPNNDRFSPLSRAVLVRKNYSMVEWLINHGADFSLIETEDSQHSNLLERLCKDIYSFGINDEERNDVSNILVLLFNKGLRVRAELLNSLSWERQLPLIIAFVIRQYLAYQPDLDLMAKKNLVSFCIQEKKADDFFAIIKQQNGNDKSQLLNYSAVCAIQNNDIEFLLRLLDNGLNINRSFSVNEHDKPLRLIEHAFMCTASEELYCCLIERQAELHFPSTTLRNMMGNWLSFAASEGWIRLLQLLLRSAYRQYINMPTYGSYYASSSYTALQIAVNHKQVDAVKILLDHHADINIANKVDETPLMLACQAGCLAIAQLLLVKGATMNNLLENPSTHLAKFISSPARSAEKVNFIELWLSYGKKINGSLLLLAISQKLDTVGIELILANLSVEEIIEQKPLHHAVEAKDLAFVECLLKKLNDERLFTRNLMGLTPLHLASQFGVAAIYNLLQDLGHMQDVPDYRGYLPLHHAVFFNTYSQLQLTLPETINQEELENLVTHFQTAEKEYKDYLLPNFREYAYKLIYLFGNKTQALVYLDKFKTKDSYQPIHDLCQFTLPFSNQAWHPAAWAALAEKYGLSLTKYLHFAPRIEQLLNKVPDNLEEIEAAVKDIKYVRAPKNIELAELFHAHQIPEQAFDRVLNDYLPKQRDYIPDITIDGQDVGFSRYYLTKLARDDQRGFILGALTACCQSLGSAGESCAWHGMTSPHGGFYVIFKRPNLNQVEAKQRLVNIANAAKNFDDFINKLSDKPQKKKYQTWKNELNNHSDEDILTQLRSKLQRELNEISQDVICAQSWAWLGNNRELVLDSWERRYEDDDKLCEPFLKKLAEQAISKFNFRVVQLGKSGQTPATLSFIPAENTIIPIDYDYYRDSYTQLIIATVANPASDKNNSITERSPPISNFFNNSTTPFVNNYSQEQFIFLLKHYTQAATHLHILEPFVIDTLINPTEKPTPQLMKSDGDGCIVPVLLTKNRWACLVIDKNDYTFLDLMGSHLPHQLANVLPKKINIWDISAFHSIYETHAFYSSVRLLALMNHYSMTGRFTIAIENHRDDLIAEQDRLLKNLQPGLNCKNSI